MAGSGTVGKSLFLRLIDQPLPFFDGLIEKLLLLPGREGEMGEPNGIRLPRLRLATVRP